ncbi:MAG: DNA-directed RNA polymerase subunit beta', partial [Rhodospirillaceae bacterium]|nr:DNA-directed RNA polymerase subunit beta' [Rhodospirillaceae bacterium]
MIENEPGAWSEERPLESVFDSVATVQHALAARHVSLHARIKARIEVVEPNDEIVAKVVDTTPGRMLLYEIMPRHRQINFERLINRVLTKKEISQIIDEVYRHCGQKETVIFADRMMSLGFTYACKAGISFGKDDMVIPAGKNRWVHQTQEQVKQYEQQYADGLITKGEKYNKVVDAWQGCSDRVADEMMQAIQAVHTTPDAQQRYRQPNSIFMMAHSGARGSAAQIKQLAGMRGLMAKPSGEIIETPIISNFKEGLSVLEYFNSTHGARKGLADTALKTANSGYLTRRLVDVAQDCIIVEVDCGTDQAISIKATVSGGEVKEDLAERILGRTAGDDIVHPKTDELIVAKGELL